MSHPTIWRCLSPVCKTPLGVVRGGEFEPWAKAEKADRRGVHVVCPNCRTPRVWQRRPAGRAPA